MTGGEARKVSPQDIQLVQNLIERCLQLYMNQKEVVATLSNQAKIEPSFTELVWQKLEEENKEFFKQYYLRLILKDQILRFNELLEKQARVMSQIRQAGAGSISLVNGGSQMHQLQENSICTTTGNVANTETMHQNINSGMLGAFSNVVPSLQTNMQTGFEMPVHAPRINVSPSTILTPNGNMASMQGLNAGMIQPEACYPGNSQFVFGNHNNNVLETRPAIPPAPPFSSFGSLESNSHHVNEAPQLVADSSSFGFLGEIPRNFSLSDLTADFANSSDILGSYSGSPFLAPQPDSLLDPHGTTQHRGHADSFLDPHGTIQHRGPFAP